jgi:hypothetical protein
MAVSSNLTRKPSRNSFLSITASGNASRSASDRMVADSSGVNRIDLVIVDAMSLLPHLVTPCPRPLSSC